MSDKELRELERTYKDSGTDEDLIALLKVLARREPLPCPSCSRRLVGSLLGEKEACSWCGTVWMPKPASKHLAFVRMRIDGAAQLAARLNTQGTQTGRLGPGPHFSNLPRPIIPLVDTGVSPSSAFGSELPRLLAGDGIRFEDSPDGTVIHRADTIWDHVNGPGPEDLRPRCEMITCAEPAWVSPRGGGILAMCLGHGIEESDRHEVPVPDAARREWELIQNMPAREPYWTWLSRVGPLAVSCPECNTGLGEFCHPSRTGAAQFHLQREILHRRLVSAQTPRALGPDFDVAHWPPESMHPDVFEGRPPRYPDDLR